MRRAQTGTLDAFGLSQSSGALGAEGCESTSSHSSVENPIGTCLLELRTNVVLHGSKGLPTVHSSRIGRVVWLWRDTVLPTLRSPWGVLVRGLGT